MMRDRCPAKGGWDGRYICGVTAAEVEEALWIKLPDRSKLQGTTRGFSTEEASGGLKENSLDNFLWNAFAWSSAPEGTTYWIRHHDRARLLDSVEIINKIRETRRLFEEGKI